MTNRATAITILVFLLVVSAACIYFDRAPAALPADAAPSEFSAVRALTHLHAFAEAPHPIGSEQHDRARDYLVAQLAALGGNPQIQKTIGVTPLYQVAGSVENIAARWKGTSGAADAVAFVAHYDSVPAGPGAGDDGSGVAAILEALRALRTGPATRNDVIAVFTDGEEAGLLGASAFVAEHPWAKDIRVAVNLDSRGNSGTSQLFETSTGNGGLIKLYAESARHASGSSLSYEVYKRLPNDTDLTLFKKAGIAGMNFGFIGNWQAYHTSLDNPEQLSPGSLQQSGENALALAQALGNADLTQLHDRDAVFASVPPGIFFHYSGSWIWPLAILCIAVFLGVAAWANGAFQTRWTQILIGFLVSAGMLAVFALVAVGFVDGVYWLHSHRLRPGSLLQSAPYLLSLFAMLAAAYSVVWLWLARRISAAAVSLGGLLVILVALLATSHWVPGASFLFGWPLLFSLVALFCGGSRTEHPSAVSVILVCLFSVPTLLLLVALIRGFFTAMGFAPTSAPALGMCFGILALLLGPLLAVLLRAGKSLVPLLALLAGGAVFAAGAATTGYSAEHPKETMMAYMLDSDSGKAFWASSGTQADAWTAHYVGSSPGHQALPYFYPSWIRSRLLTAPASTITVAPPEAQLVEKTTGPDGRTLHLRITSPRHAPQIRVFAPGTTVLEASVNGHPLGKPSDARWDADAWGFDFANLPPEGIDLVLRTAGNGAVRLMVTDQSLGLPDVPGTARLPRAPECIPIQWGDSTLVHRSFAF